MTQKTAIEPPASSQPGYDLWRRDYERQLADPRPVTNRSGIEIKPLYIPADWDSQRYAADLGFPGQPPMTRGIYPSMYRGRIWSQRQLVGLGTPEHYNRRLRRLIDAGVTAISLIPCNSVYRGYDIDEVDPLLVGTCGTTVNTIEDMESCFDNIDIGRISTAMNDPLPFTLLALLLGVARRRGIAWRYITGTSNQSDYISHFVANHMFVRLALPGARRVLVDHIAFCTEQVPNWNPLSVVGQHMQQAGATPAQAMAFTLCTAILYVEDCLNRNLDPEQFLPRFTFFFDISISFFEEIAKFRAGRRLWQKIVRERFGVNSSRARRFKFHAQTSGVDLTRQQPLNNIARVTAQAMAGIFGGLQSLHTDAYDEVLSTPTESAAQIAVATQNILRGEAHLTDVIDPLAGSYYVETLTNQMEEHIESIIGQIDDAGGMFKAVEQGLVQRMINESSREFQRRVENAEQLVVGVNAYQVEEEQAVRRPLERPDPECIGAQVNRLSRFKAGRDQNQVGKALDRLAAAANRPDANVFAAVVDAVIDGVTHGEAVACLRRELGFGEPLIVA